MFSRWFFARLRAAENALHSGRIDDALVHLQAADPNQNRNAEKLVGELAKALLARARLHAQAGRYRDALDDLDRLQSVGRSDAEAAALRQRVSEELRHRAERHAEKREAIDRASEELRAGRLETGRLAIDQLEDAKAREQLREELDIRVQRSEQLLEQAAEALRGGNVLAGCRFWSESVQRHGRSRASDALATELVSAFQKSFEAWVSEGRLDRLAGAVEAAGALRSYDAHWGEHVRLCDLARQAAGALASGSFEALRDALLRMRAARPDAKWVQDSLGSVATILEAEAHLLAGPLGLVDPALRESLRFRTAEGGVALHNRGVGIRRESAVDAASLRGSGLLLLVDGTGSALLTNRDIVRIGRVGSGGEVDVPMPASIQSLHAEVMRHGSDYFLVARGPTRVNGKPVQRALLRDGDRVVLGDSGKFVFHKPSARSESAVLKLSDRCRLPHDVNLVVLFQSTALIGPQPTSHIQTREGETRLVLFEREGRLFVRTDRGGHARDGGVPLPLRQTCDFGDVRVTAKEYEAGSAGSAV